MSSEWLIENPTDGSLLVLIPGGRFFTGERTERLGGCSPFWVDVSSFHLALHPVTNAQYRRFVDATGHPPPRRHDTGESVWKSGGFPPQLADHPVVYVSWFDARAYCEWAGVRLPTELEWERAARGSDSRRFPWGDEWDPARCRSDENRRRATTASVWSHPDGVSAWGCYNLSGNVWEWCADGFEAAAYRRYSRGDRSPPPPGKTRVARGGSWFNVAPETFACGYRHEHRPESCDPHYGFRVAR